MNNRLFHRHWSRLCVGLLLSIMVFPVVVNGQGRVRNEVTIPDVAGYVLLKCDLHMHTVFSDGNVWPTVRVEEAWREGLDAIAITDHIEYQPHKADVPTNFNRSYELAEPLAKTLDIIIVKGAEITRDLPPGHINAIFLNDAKPLDTKDYRDAVKAAVDQGAFVFWNHPDYKHPQGKTEWFPEHTELLSKGWLHGIEVVNGRDYYPMVQGWCLEKKLTMMGDTDVHDPIALSAEDAPGEHRPMTVVLAKERTKESLKEALFARRTMVYIGNMLIGEQQYLKPVFDASVAVVKPAVSIKGQGRATLQIRNRSEIRFELELAGEPADIGAPKSLTLHPEKTVLCEIRGKSADAGTRKIAIPYVVKNLLIAPEKGLPVTLDLEVTFTK